MCVTFVLVTLSIVFVQWVALQSCFPECKEKHMSLYVHKKKVVLYLETFWGLGKIFCYNFSFWKGEWRHQRLEDWNRQSEVNNPDVLPFVASVSCWMFECVFIQGSVGVFRGRGNTFASLPSHSHGVVRTHQHINTDRHTLYCIMYSLFCPTALLSSPYQYHYLTIKQHGNSLKGQFTKISKITFC